MFLLLRYCWGYCPFKNIVLTALYTKCVWCCKMESARHPESKLLLISYDRMGSFQEPQGGTGRLENVRQNKLTEVRSLQSLLRDYSSIISRYAFQTSGVKSSYIKDILNREFDGKMGFHSHTQRNLSNLVYDTSGGGGGSYV